MSTAKKQMQYIYDALVGCIGEHHDVRFFEGYADYLN
jgi:hypothetical protein